MSNVDIYISTNVIVKRPIHFLFLLVNKKMNLYEAYCPVLSSATALLLIIKHILFPILHSLVHN